jgi:hypothetical protein
MRVSRRRDADFEVADSDEEYGWQEEDSESLPPLPPQWQGSEDILLGHQPDSDTPSRPDDAVDEQVEDDEGAND